MESLIITTFKTIQDATTGLNMLKQLDATNDITIYNLLMVRKRDEGNYELLYRDGLDIASSPPYEEMAGLLFNMIDVPVRLAVSVFSELLKVVSLQNRSTEISDGFLGQFSRELQLTTFTILVDLEKDNTCRVEQYMNDCHGFAFCTDIVDLYHKYLIGQWRMLIETGAGREESYRPDNIRRRIARIQDRMQDRIEILKGKIEITEGEVRERLKFLKEGIGNELRKFNE
jgi:hypothetical protein